MNYYDSIKLDIYESYDNGEISYDEKEYLLEEVNYMYEKHVSPKRRKENLKRRNELSRKHFEEKYKYDPETETIELNGKRVPVKFNSKFTGIEPDTSTLHIDKIFFRLKSPEQQKAIIDHEIGHASLQATTKDAPLRNPKLETDQGLYATISNRNKALANVISNKQIKQMTKEHHKTLRDEMGYDKNKPLSDDQQKRNSILQKLSKHEVNSNRHANRAEFEADLYASQQQKTGKGQMLSGLKNCYKHQLNGFDRKGKEPKIRHEIQRNKFARDRVNRARREMIDSGNTDYYTRVKALNDKSITDEEKSIYRNKYSNKNKPDKYDTNQNDKSMTDEEKSIYRNKYSNKNKPDKYSIDINKILKKKFNVKNARVVSLDDDDKEYLKENYYDDIRLDIYESYDNGEISYNEKEYLLEEVNNAEYNDYYYEYL